MNREGWTVRCENAQELTINAHTTEVSKSMEQPTLALISPVTAVGTSSSHGSQVITNSEIKVNSMNEKDEENKSLHSNDKYSRVTAAFGKASNVKSKGIKSDDRLMKDEEKYEQINESLINFDKNAAKWLAATSGAVLVGLTGYRYLRNYFDTKEMEKYIRPSTALTNLLNHILLKMDPTTNKPIKVSTADVLSSDTVVAFLFTGKGVEDIITKNGFPPLLTQIKKLYENCKKNNQKLEIIYISLDRNPKDSLTHFQQMPWYALPFGDWKTKRQLINEFNVKRFPAIVTVNGDGTVINNKAYTAMLSSPNGYPWKPQSVDDILNRGLINNKLTAVDPATLRGKTIGLYFSANWCPPCQAFTPKLAEVYKTLKEQKSDFEIIFISNDENEEKFNEYFGTRMPWLAIPYSDVSGRAMLQDLLEVTTLPKFVLLDENHRIINGNARKAVEMDPTGESFPWSAKEVEELSESSDGLYENPSFLLFMEGADEATQKMLQKNMLDVAKRVEAEEGGKKFSFFTVSSSSPQSVGLRRLFKLPILTNAVDSATKQKTNQPRLVAFDLSNKAYYKDRSDVHTVDSISSFVDAYRNNKLSDIMEIIVLPTRRMKDR